MDIFFIHFLKFLDKVFKDFQIRTIERYAEQQLKKEKVSTKKIKERKTWQD